MGHNLIGPLAAGESKAHVEDHQHRFSHHYERTEELGIERDEDAISRFVGMIGGTSIVGGHFHPTRRDWPRYRQLTVPSGIFHVRAFCETTGRSVAVPSTNNAPISALHAYAACAYVAGTAGRSKASTWIGTKAREKIWSSVLDLEVSVTT